MDAVDQNGLKFSVFQCGIGAVRDIYWNVYTLQKRTGETETYVKAGTNDVLLVERCGCEGDHDPAPGASIFNGDHVERCDDCTRFDNDDDASRAYVAGLNLAVGYAYFDVTLDKDYHYCVSLASAPVIVLNEEEISNELKQLGVVIQSTPYKPKVTRKQARSAAPKKLPGKTKG